jgi:hypothetical protein
MSLDTAVVYAALVVGALMLATVSYRFAKIGDVSRGGIVLSSFGFLLMGLSVWSQINFKANKNGIEFALRSIKEVAINIEDLSHTVREEVAARDRSGRSRSLAAPPSPPPGGGRDEIGAIRKEIDDLLAEKRKIEQAPAGPAGLLGTGSEDVLGSAIKSSHLALIQAQIAVKEAKLESRTD